MGQIQQLISAKNSIIDLYDGDGTNAPLTFTIKDEDGVVINISSWTIEIVIKERLDSTSDILSALAGAFVTDGTDGQVQFDFAAVNFTATFKNAYMTLYRIVAAKNWTLKQFTLNVVPNGTGA